jgi:hypothetical protein
MSGKAAFGTVLKMGATPAAIANITRIGGPQFSTETIDVTSHDSGSAYREIVPTFLSAGEVALDLNFDPTKTSHKDITGGLLNVWKNRTLEDFVIEFPVTPTASVAFEAYVTGFEPDSPFDDKLAASVTLTISGPVTWTYGT